MYSIFPECNVIPEYVITYQFIGLCVFLWKYYHFFLCFGICNSLETELLTSYGHTTYNAFHISPSCAVISQLSCFLSFSNSLVILYKNIKSENNVICLAAVPYGLVHLYLLDSPDGIPDWARPSQMLILVLADFFATGLQHGYVSGSYNHVYVLMLPQNENTSQPTFATKITNFK